MEDKEIKQDTFQEQMEKQNEVIKQRDIEDIPGAMFDQIGNLQVDEHYGYEQDSFVEDAPEVDPEGDGFDGFEK